MVNEIRFLRNEIRAFPSREGALLNIDKITDMLVEILARDTETQTKPSHETELAKQIEALGKEIMEQRESSEAVDTLKDQMLKIRDFAKLRDEIKADRAPKPRRATGTEISPRDDETRGNETQGASSGESEEFFQTVIRRKTYAKIAGSKRITEGKTGWKTPEMEDRMKAVIEVRGGSKPADTVRAVRSVLQPNLGELGPFKGVHPMQQNRVLMRFQTGEQSNSRA